MRTKLAEKGPVTDISPRGANGAGAGTRLLRRLGAWLAQQGRWGARVTLGQNSQVEGDLWGCGGHPREEKPCGGGPGYCPSLTDPASFRGYEWLCPMGLQGQDAAFHPQLTDDNTEA